MRRVRLRAAQNVHVLCECEDDNEEDTTFERFRTLTTSMQWGTEVEVVG